MPSTLDTSAPDPGSKRYALRSPGVSVAIVFALCAAFYFWSADATAPLIPTPAGYFNPLTDAFLHGQVALLIKPRAELLALRDPYDSQANALYRFHDALLYKGKYYLYWGVSPVLLLYLPVRVLTGQYVNDAVAAALFASLGLLFYMLLLNKIREDYFPSSNLLTAVLLYFLFGFGSMAPFIVRRPYVYEVAITCAYFLTGAFLYFAYQAAFRGSLKLKYVLAAGLALGLVFLSRPNLAACGIVLVTGVYLYWRQESRRYGISALRVFGLALGPPLICIALQGYYNFVRFGSAAEYGIKYQLNAETVHTSAIFSVGRSVYGLVFYLFGVPSFSPIFPFATAQSGLDALSGPFRWVADGLASMVAAGSVYQVVGIFVGVPLLLVFFVARALSRRLPFNLRAFFLSVLFATLVTGFFTAGVGVVMRYELDFLPGLLLTAAVLFLCLESEIRERFARVLFASVLFAGVFYTVCISSAISISYDNRYRGQHPDEYRELVKFFSPIELRLIHFEDYSRAVVAHVTLPPPKACGAPALGQPLLASGVVQAGDFLYLQCKGAPGKFAVAWDHWGAPLTIGRTFVLSGSGPVTVELTAPALFPPLAVDGGRVQFPAEEWGKVCAVRINGREVFRENACQMYPSSSSETSFFRNLLGGSTTAPVYAGKVISVERRSTY